MATKLPTTALRRASLPSLPSHIQTCRTQQTRHASLLKRPHRPYTFTQLVTLSDGSTYMQRTTSPAPIYRSTKDTRNHPLWQPSLDSLRNVEQDDAGRLKAFRKKFGRGWDAEADVEEGEGQSEGEGGFMAGDGGDGEGSLMDLISGGSAQVLGNGRAGGVVAESEVMQEMVTVRKDGVLVKVPAKKRAGAK
ncbi:hypothetical protein LZ554_000201 [Drepanopeziza brunnea f. sp. 'monogermtubi']|nr:hypothetical protein LZ554_000201 [Drepanopeziza brunnea f. sp. 'monogermtubi']